MKSIVKTIFLIFTLALFAACGGGGDGSSSSTSGEPLAVNGAGVAIDRVEGSGVPADIVIVLDINDAQQAIGYAVQSGGSFVASIWTIGPGNVPMITPRALQPIAGNSFSAAFAIDEAGRSVGQSGKGAQQVAVYWAPGSSIPTELPALTATGNSVAYSISADGTCIVGEAQNAALATRAVAWIANPGGNFTAAPIVLPVNLAGSTLSSGNGVSRSGAQIQVAGFVEDGAGVARATLWRSADSGATFTATDLRTPGELGSYAYAVDTGGRVVGESETAPGLFAAALWTAAGGIYNRSILAADGSAVAINTSGKISGMSGNSATVWDATAPGFSPVTLYGPSSQAFGANNGDASGYLVVGILNGKGFVKRVN